MTRLQRTYCGVHPMTDSAEAGLSLARFFGSSLSNAVLFILMSLLGHQTSGH